ncbi:MAG TPA: hypothetical protein VED20_08680 [Streptosporangiaceae bacterium]|nr:hypothetical protein [Streptosporangiaceae bacterium]
MQEFAGHADCARHRGHGTVGSDLGLMAAQHTAEGGPGGVSTRQRRPITQGRPDHGGVIGQPVAFDPPGGVGQPVGERLNSCGQAGESGQGARFLGAGAVASG